jgi:hypothetical protein
MDTYQRKIIKKGQVTLRKFVKNIKETEIEKLINGIKIWE